MRTAARPDSTLSAPRRGPQAVVAMRFPIALLASAALLAPATAHAAVTPPPPTGPAPVGLERLTLTDHHRTERLVPGGGPRLIPPRAWYPAPRRGSARGDVLPAAEQSPYEWVFELPAGARDGIGSPTTADAPPAAGKHPVILLSPGWGTRPGSTTHRPATSRATATSWSGSTIRATRPPSTPAADTSSR